tara:strand:+ start:493 stop:936 length:444 start_codon:yes stop_codon:yes gene_type:complete
MKVILNKSGSGITDLFINERICELYEEKSQCNLTGLSDHDLKKMRHDNILVNILENLNDEDLESIDSKYVIVTIPNQCEYQIKCSGAYFQEYEEIETYLEFTIDEMLSGLGEENKNLIGLVDKILVKDNVTRYPINHIKNEIAYEKS